MSFNADVDWGCVLVNAKLDLLIDPVARPVPIGDFVVTKA
jgi:hypothetical protein